LFWLVGGQGRRGPKGFIDTLVDSKGIAVGKEDHPETVLKL